MIKISQNWQYKPYVELYIPLVSLTLSSGSKCCSNSHKKGKLENFGPKGFDSHRTK